MCTRYRVCGRRHVSKYKRDRRGQFVTHRPFLKAFLTIFGFYAVSMIGVNTIIDWAKDLEKVLVVENTEAVETITITWQDEVKAMIRDAGLDVDLADRIIQHESWWKEDNKHWNNAIVRNNKIVQPAHWDRGLWMISEYWHPEVSDECAFDWFCSTREAIRIWKNRGPQEWVAYQYVK